MCNIWILHEVQLSNRKFPTEVTEDGIDTWTNDLQCTKAHCSIDVNEIGLSNVICFNFSCPRNASALNVVTDDGITIFFKLTNSLNALVSISVGDV